jgi:1-acyl-sn-glycerol-3-phosphate acyltransferase
LSGATKQGAELLLTGATGFLGKVVLHELLLRAEELQIARVHLLIRPTQRSTPESRWRGEILGSPCFAELPAGWERRIEVVAGELVVPDAGMEPDTRAALAQRLTHIVHCAASVQFDLPLAQAAAANTTSALHVLALARECPRLASLVSVSTAYTTPHAGDRVPIGEHLAPLPRAAGEIYASILNGSVDEKALLAETGHPNTYTLTKCLTEHLLAEGMGELPLTLIRPSIISASLRRPSPGWIDSPAAFALFIMSIASGRMRAIIAKPGVRLDVVPCDAVASRIVDAAFTGRAPVRGRPIIRHAVAGFERSPTLADCRRKIEAYFQCNPIEGLGGRAADARVRYLGRDGPLYWLNRWLHHSRRADARIVAGKLEQTNRVFSYFTHNTFRFQSSVPLDDPAFEPNDYVETVCRGVARHLMDGDESAVSLAGALHTRARGDLRWALTQPSDSVFIRLAAFLVAQTLRRCTRQVTFDRRSVEAALADAPPGAPLVIVPTHRSYLDFVLVSYLAFARPDLGIDVPYVAAAAEFGRIPLLGPLLRRLHAFYVRRGVGREEKELTSQVHALIHQGRTIEFFIEGTRSRDRRFLAPRRGLLRGLQATGEPIALLPLAISYERVPEELRFSEELGGAASAPPQLRRLLGWALRVARGEVDLGRIHLAAGRLVTLDLSTDVHAAARALMEQLQARVSVTTQQLHAFLDAERESLDGVDLRWLRRAVARRGGRVLDSDCAYTSISASAALCMRHQFEHFFYADAADAFSGNPAIEHLIRRNGYPKRDAGREAPDGADPHLARVLRALFAPVCRDFSAVARALGSPGTAPALGSPRAALDAGRVAHLPHAEAAFEDLAARGILVREGAGFAWGPRADEIEAYRAACARGFAADSAECQPSQLGHGSPFSLRKAGL